MKKTLLITAACLLMAAGAMAQDIWLGAFQYDNQGNKNYTLSKNGTVVKSHASEGFSYEMTDILYGENGKVYYLNHLMPVDNDPMRQWTDLRVQDGSTNEYLYNCPTSQGRHLKGLAYEDGDVYACGSFHSTDGRDYSYIVKNDAVFYESPENGYYNDMYGIDVCDGDVFTCGGESSSEGNSSEDWVYATVWKNGQRIAEWSSSYSFAYDIAIYNGVLYVCGKIKQDGVWKGALWSCSANASGEQLALIVTVSDSESICKHLYNDAGTIYLSYMLNGGDCGVAKYIVEAADFIDVFNYSGSNASLGNIVVNNHGIYTTSNDASKYYLDGQPVSTSVEGYVSKIAVACPMHDMVYDLPYDDNFSYGETYWDDWFVYDYDKDNGYYASYWDRVNRGSDISVKHRYNITEQECDIASPAFSLPNNVNVTLTFQTKVKYLQDFEISSVWVIENEEGIMLTQDNFEDFSQDKVWDMADVIGEMDEDSWKLISVDLSEYAGKTINIVFYYSGTNAHDWYIDDVSVDCSVGISDNEVNDLAVYPNPATDYIRIDGIEANSEVQVFNALGELVKTARVNADNEVGVGELASGLYLVRCGKSSLRFVKQ